MAVTVLSALGVLSIWADRKSDGTTDGPKQLIFAAVGVVAMAVVQAINYQKIGRFAWTLYILGLGMVLYTIVPFTHVAERVQTPLMVPYTNGAYAWINAGPIKLQPTELMKIGFILVMARYLRFRNNYRTFKGLLGPFLLALAPIGLILKQPDLGTVLIFVPVLFAMLFVAGAQFRHLLAIVGMGLALAPLMWLSGTDMPVFRHMPVLVKDYQRARVYALFSNDPAISRKENFQPLRALMALGSGGLSGKGIGVVPIGGLVPEAHNDMILALIGEQFGFFGVAAILAAYIVLFATGVEIAARTREPFGRLVAIGIVALLAGQAFLNLSVTLRMMPVTGVTLPFVSYGGSSLLSSFIAAGLLLNVGQNRPLVMARNAFEFD